MVSEMKLLKFPGKSLTYSRDQFVAVDVLEKEYVKEEGDWLIPSERDMTPEELKSRNWFARLFNTTTVKYYKKDVFAPYWEVRLYLNGDATISEIYYEKEKAYEVEARIKEDVLG